MRFTDRQDAGRQLAGALAAYRGRGDVVVLGLPRGGVIVAREVARALDLPLDVLVVRKLGVPGHEELAMGAVASGGVRVLDRVLVNRLMIGPQAVEHVAQRELRELDRREQAYRDGRLALDVAGRTVLLVDDGLATGSTMKAAVEAVRARHPARIVVAAPVGAEDSCEALGRLADEVVCLSRPELFWSVGSWYAVFGDTSDDEVRAALAEGIPAPSA